LQEETPVPIAGRPISPAVELVLSHVQIELMYAGMGGMCRNEIQHALFAIGMKQLQCANCRKILSLDAQIGLCVGILR
jgi:hypothetical protein